MDFHDVEIRGKDSIFIFMECFIPPGTDTESFRVTDRLEFITNGNLQEVEVVATARNARRLRGVRVESDLTLDAKLPYIIFDSLSVEKGATLKIMPGAELLFHYKAHLSVRGRIEATGTPGNMIHMRGDRLDDVIPGTSYDMLAGQWQGMRIGRESFDNRMEFVDMRSTVDGLRIDSCGDLSLTKLTLVNSWLHNSQTNVLECRHARVDAFGCVFSESPLAVVSLSGGAHDFRHCTIANNYLFAAVTEPNLTLSHCMPKAYHADAAPLMNATFENCIIWGIGQPLSPENLTGSAVHLRNVLIKADGSDNSNFISCIWNEDPLFLTSRSDYVFNYRLGPGSPAIGKGNPEYVNPVCRHDMDGLDRLYPGAPTLGAYEFSPLSE